MKDSIVRILKVELHYFRNVNYGKVEFKEPGILGIYGQNGSGKTSVINVMQLLKDLILEEKIEDQLYENISIWSDFSKISYTFSLQRFEEEYKIVYDFIIRKDKDLRKAKIDSEKFTIQCLDNSIKKREKIKFENEVNFQSNEFINDIFGFTKSSKIFDAKTLLSINVIKGICQKNNTSFIFNKELIDILHEHGKKNKDLYLITNALNAFVNYALMNLFVINTKDSSIITTYDLMPLNLRLINNKDDEYGILSGIIPVNLFGSQLISEVDYEVISNAISEINIIMPTLLPNFEIVIIDLGVELMKDGTKGKKIEFVSVINGHKIPLKNESEGTKKIISICSALISVYNNKNVCLCIDEFDSGIFEYLLGQLLKILSQGAKGQILFTSHNLRPLEVLSKENIYITTTNINNRYIKMKNIKPSNNIRDFYLRGLQIGGQNEEIYYETDLGDIARAFRRAGEIHNGIKN